MFTLSPTTQRGLELQAPKASTAARQGCCAQRRGLSDPSPGWVASGSQSHTSKHGVSGEARVAAAPHRGVPMWRAPSWRPRSARVVLDRDLSERTGGTGAAAASRSAREFGKPMELVVRPACRVASCPPISEVSRAQPASVLPMVSRGGRRSPSVVHESGARGRAVLGGGETVRTGSTALVETARASAATRGGAARRSSRRCSRRSRPLARRARAIPPRAGSRGRSPAVTRVGSHGTVASCDGPERGPGAWGRPGEG